MGNVNCRLGQLAIGLELLCIESHVEERERKTGESPPAKLGGRERFYGRERKKIYQYLFPIHFYKFTFYMSVSLTRSSITVSSSEKSVEPSSFVRFQSVFI